MADSVSTFAGEFSAEFSATMFALLASVVIVSRWFDKEDYPAEQ